MDEFTRIADAVQKEYCGCYALYTNHQAQGSNIGIRHDSSWEWQSTRYQEYEDDYDCLVDLADGAAQVVDIITYCEGTTSATMYAVEWANEDEAHDDGDGWRKSEKCEGYYRVGDEIDIGDICGGDDDDDDEDERW